MVAEVMKKCVRLVRAIFNWEKGYILLFIDRGWGVRLIGQICYTNASSAREKVSTVPNGVEKPAMLLEFTFDRLGEIILLQKISK
jgi:hypothetical protein